MADVMTLPILSRRWNVSLDTLRAIVRRTPGLASLGGKIGATKVYDANDVKKIRAALDSRQKPAAATV